MIRYFRPLAVFALASTLSSTVDAAYRITVQDRADIERIETYLNTVNSLRSKFVQISTGGRIADGTIYIDRPKRLRLEYKNPPNIHVYVSGDWLAHVDTELEAVWHVPLQYTPAEFLVRDKISLSGDITIERVVRDSRTITLSVMRTAEPDSGKIEFIFSDAPLMLRKWTVTDAQGISTSVTLVAPVFNVEIPGDVFVFEQFKFEERTD
jgi:outer membrane lipoprotein-sorting protein